MHKRKEIVSRFFDKGHLLTPEALDFLAESKDYEKILDASILVDKAIIEKDDFAAFETKNDSVRIIKNLLEKPSELTPDIFNSFLISKFEKMKALFMERTDKSFLSLDKIDNQRQEVYVIGMVRDVSREDGKMVVEIEDRTRSLKAVFTEPVPRTLPEEDDVVCIGGIGAKEVIFGKEIIYPDVPLREPSKGIGRICAISDLHLNEAPADRLVKFFDWLGKQDIKYLFIAGDTADYQRLAAMVKEHIPDKTVFIIPGNMDDANYPGLPMKPDGGIICLSNPSMVEINGIKVLLIHRFDQSFLKKRYLGRSSVILKEDYLVLDVIPDIVIYGHTHEPSVSNYKSITIANPGSLLAEFRPVVINLETREYQQLAFD